MTYDELLEKLDLDLRDKEAECIYTLSNDSVMFLKIMDFLGCYIKFKENGIEIYDDKEFRIFRTSFSYKEHKNVPFDFFYWIGLDWLKVAHMFDLVDPNLE